MTSYIQAVEKLIEQQERDALDAARYRWLRKADWSDIKALYWSPEMQDTVSIEEVDSIFDRVIDAAISADKKEKA